MIQRRPSDQRGRVDMGWLQSAHSFSFGNYHDARHMGFRQLRVINEDIIQPARGFGTHGHRDMEIISYVVEGELEHRDSMGNGSIIRPGDVQRMSAGTGVMHSEHNPSKTAPMRLLQIWLLPEQRGLTPSYEQRHYDAASRQGRLCLVAARDGRDGALTVHQDVSLYAGLLAKGDRVQHSLAAGRHAWIQVVSGAVTVNGHALHAGDGAAISAERELDIVNEDSASAELLLFDLA
ncbi:MAG: pirin family protein [Haliangiales bacterium]